jgi:4-hydroxy-2-oxoheptanedioate aldolase
MDLPRNTFKHALAAGKPQIGLWLSLSSNYSAEVCAGSGFDWLLIDTEHSPNELDMVFGQLQAIAPYPSHPVVRVAWNDPVIVKRTLDVGAQTLLFPFVQDAEEAARAVAATRYPPRGIRGVAGTTRATRFGRVKDYAKRAHEETCVLVQVETQEAVDAIESIAKVGSTGSSSAQPTTTPRSATPARPPTPPCCRRSRTRSAASARPARRPAS